MSLPLLCVVVPCFNEEAMLAHTVPRLLAELQLLHNAGLVAQGSHACLVDDGSRDRTWSLIEQAAQSDVRIKGLKLAHNCGHQNALLAGLMHAEGDIVISLDADLQDDPAAMQAMVRAWQGGADVVYGVRSSRSADSWFKRCTARAFYRGMQALGVEMVFDHADYRLLSRRAVEALRGYRESELFLRGIIPRLGYRTAMVAYERHSRVAGESKYPLLKMLAFALKGVTSFSAAPLRAITLLGLAVSLLSFVGGAWVLVAALVGGLVVPGWASTLLPIFLLGGVQLLSLGVIGEYVAKIHIETKQRPRFVVETRASGR